MADKETNSKLNQVVVKQDKGKTEIRRTVQHLPAFYRTDSNQRFLSSTMDQLVQKGSLQRLDGFIGKQDAYTRKVTDRYLTATSSDRFAYQLDPAVTYTDKDTTSINPEDQVTFTATYDDYINQIKYLGGKNNNHDRLNKETVYSWNPAIDYDKLINYREYYWMPNGPNAIEIDALGTATAEYKVAPWPTDGSSTGAWNFTHREDERNPVLTLYRGNTYKFIVNASGHPFWIMTEPYKSQLSEDGSTSTLYSTGVTNNGTEVGTITFTVPTDAPDTLYYQCGVHDAMYGVLQCRTIGDTTKIDPDKDIIGVKNYKLRTLELSNGMKVKFKTSLVDEAWQTNQYYVEGVGDAITLTNVENLITPEKYATETTILYDSAEYDSRPYAKAFYLPETKDYISIKRDSLDQNAWSRYNRWFHRSVIEKTADIGGFTPDLKEEDRAKRPIIEFDSGIALYNHGTVAKNSVTVFDTATTDAFSTVVNTNGYIVDGIPLTDGMRVIFAADNDTIVKNKIYIVNFVHASDDSTVTSAQQDSTAVIALTEASDAAPVDGNSVYVEFGTENQGKTYYYNGTTATWVSGQNKTAVNQQPLFRLFDDNGVALDDTTTYPTSSFEGAKVFEYSISDTATKDTVLGLKVKYNTINNVGDIVFESDHTSGTFTFTQDTVVKTKKLASAHLQYTTSVKKNNSISAWLERTNESKQRVIRTFIVDETEKQLFPVDFYKNSSSLSDLEVSVKVNGVRKNLTTDYTLVNGTTNTYVRFVDELEVNDQIRLAGYSSADKVEGKGIYEVAENISINAKSQLAPSFTFGQILNHVQDIFDKNQDVTGTIPGVSTLRDHPDARLKGGTILQHTGSLLPAMFGLIDQESNVINAIDYVSREYEKWYNAFLTKAIGTAYEGVAGDRVDEIIEAIAQGRNTTFPFYYEDMVGWGENVSTRTYTANDPEDTEYAIDSIFDTSTLSNRALSVYVNDVLLVLGSEYTVSTTDDSITILATIASGDIIKIKDYPDTTGSYIPPTPSKLGIYPKFKPESFTDDTYVTSQTMIRRHDGSIVKAYGDERDDLILELERRIYNNIKISYDKTRLDIGDVMPSAFKSTEYTLTDFNDVIGPDFYAWAGRNNVQYINNTTFTEGSAFTYNYSQSTDTRNSQTLPGYWRGIYKYFYDTDSPHIRPWEILGHSEKPSDWETLYGPAPYTAGNSTLWSAIESEPGRYGKPGITNYIPVDASGNLLNPFVSGLVKHFNLRGRKASWKFGDQAPAETAWRRSSAYPFSVVKGLAITKPAKFFSLFFDNSRLSLNIANNLVDKDTQVRQTLVDAKYHLETLTNNTTGVVTRYQTAGYQPLVVNHLMSKNLDTNIFYYKKMKALDVQLAYKLGGFTDKDNLKILTDSISPGSTAGSKIIPDENYKILFRTSNPVASYNYSGVLIEKNTETTTDTDGSTVTFIGGYKVLGYSTSKPFFNFLYPKKTTQPSAVIVAGVRAEKFANYSETVQTIPYGHVFDTVQEVVDFLFGYGKYLESQGFNFDKYSNGLKETINFDMSVKEFLFWTTQQWAPGAAITVSPGADGFSLDTENSTVGKLRNLAGDYSLLDSAGRKIDISEISTKRIGKTFDIGLKTDTGLYNIALNTVQKEHMILFDNKTVFSDLIYDPLTGFRQARVKVVGWKTGGWNGDYYAPGFIFDSAQVSYWSANTDYRIGDTVEYQGKFYVARYNHTSVSQFVTDNWILKSEKPAPQLIPNFDYKISQFNDFYNLETNNFDESQQSLAQHLIGYQNRDYLENLFVNDISQYKFYQGYIREKGTQSAIDNILKAQYEEQDLNVDLYPEWMIKTGIIGNADARESIQFTLNETEVTNTPQSIELQDTSNEALSYRRSVAIPKDKFYKKPTEYTASTTFHQYDYTKEGVDRDTVQVYKTAGYPQVGQVHHTLYNETDLLNLNVATLKQNELIWIAKMKNTAWDVLRFTSLGLRIANLKTLEDNTQLEITFTDSHGLSAGTTTNTADYFAITNSQETDLNQVYEVLDTPNHKKVVIEYLGDIGFIPNLEDGSTADSFGNVYSFKSMRITSMDNANINLNYSDYKDKDDSIEREGDKLYADTDTSGLWNVYEKQDPYKVVKTTSPQNIDDQDFGYQVIARQDGRTVVVSAPTSGQGQVHFLFRTTATPGQILTLQSTQTMTDNDDDTSMLGYSLSMSTDENFVVAGAPYTNVLQADGSTRYNDAGLVKIYAWDSNTLKYNFLNTITAPLDGSTVDSAQAQTFGWSHKICEPGVDSVRSTPTKYLFVGAPGYDSDTGQVYMYEWSVGADGSTYDSWTNCLTLTSADPGQGKKFGYRIEANDDGNILAVSSKAPGQAGKVEIYVRTSQASDDSTQHSFSLVQTLEGVSADGSSLNTEFGEAMTMTKDGGTLIVGAPGYDDSSQSDAGIIYIYKWDINNDSTLIYTLDQTIKAPDTQNNMKFGSSVHINNSATRLVIGAEKFSNNREMRFDSGETTFDLQDTLIVDENVGSGGVYTATKYNTKFIIDDLLVTTSVSENDNFGKGVFITDNQVFVGSPDDDNNITSDGSTPCKDDGTVTVFDVATAGHYAWKPITTETPLIDIGKLGQAFQFNKISNTILDYYDLYDPIKGRILGVADREINIKTEWDPASYNVGPNANTKTMWGEKHIGEVWWDLSTARWLWYEQDTQEYKTNNWGKLFPGSSIDIYEWVETQFLPSEWAERSLTQNGVADGITGTPLYSDDSQYTVKQKYSSLTDNMINFYYYWVKGKTDIPANSVVTRKNTIAYVANLIANTRNFDIKYFAGTDKNKLILGNSNNLLGDYVVANIDIRTNNFDAIAHSIWKLNREGDKEFRPGKQIETNWWNSLIGQNDTGDKIPDPELPANERYGNNIRPRQSWYVDRFSALKEIIDYSNTVLKKYQLAGVISLDNLNSADPEPTTASLEWDATVDTYADLTYISTADISGTTKYLVKKDETTNNYWAIYTWDGSVWSKTKIQTYNTGNFWTYIDWYGTDPAVHGMVHDENTKIDKQVTYQYELETLDLEIGKHVKVTSSDTGGWKLFMKTSSGWTNVGTENGTIRISTKLYDYTQDDTGYAGEDNFDENFFDQEPAIETRKVLTALRDDLFINDIAVEYNTLFFTGLRKVLSEQTYVDWMFKTSFVNARNSVRQLDQRKTYTTGTDTWIEDYINEVKPFHTTLREYKLGYQSTDTQDSMNTDFDNPAFYDASASKIRTLNVSADTDKLTENPHQFWYDYHKKHVKSITLTNAGSGYTQTPTVTITGGGGSGATATATISGGKVSKVTLTAIGKDYTTTPTITISGGKDDGTAPTDQSKAYANLNNDLVRDFDTTIKFDRITSTSNVVDWAASTSYAYGALIRYKNELYKSTKAFTSTTDWDEGVNNLYKIYGDETGFSAADRVKGFYTPMTGMKGNELSQVMTGVDYGGTVVTGLLFSQGQGWDKSPWSDFSWDVYGKTEIVSFTADGSTNAFTFTPAPAVTKVYQVYITEDDSTRRKLSDVFRGDGSTSTFIISEVPNENALVEFIPFDDDGVLTPTDDRTIGSFIGGGLFSSALGTAPSDIVLEGQDFVSPESSYAPEEVVPGQLFDTVDIQVYTSPESGAPFISSKNSRGDGTTTTFPIGDYPGTLGSVTVSVNNSVKKLTTDYTVNVNNKTITFGTAPAMNALIATRVFAISGENYRVLDQYVGDGSTVTFTTGTRGEFNLDSTASEIYITIEGVPTTAFTTTTTANTITVTFTSAPAANAFIQIAGFNKSSTSTRSYASIRSEQITYDGSTSRYTLTYPPGSIGPLSGLTIVEINGKVLRGPDISYYQGDGSTYNYNPVAGLGEDSTIDPYKTITSASQIKVHVNGVEQINPTDYTVNTTTNIVELVNAPTSTDVIAISTLVDNQYYNESNDVILDTTQIAADGLTLSAEDVISVTTFNNALGMKLRREVLEGKASGVFTLRYDSMKSGYAYVWLDGEQLTEGSDYRISGNVITVSNRTITSANRLDVMYFAQESSTGATGYRIFKDMLNRTFFKRISKNATTELIDDVTSDSTVINVKDATNFETPNASLNQPGVIFINKERIEYFTRDGNTFGQLRRGTLGTGIKDHSDGTRVVSAGGSQTIPYVETVTTDTFTGDGSTTTFTITNTPTYTSELDIFIGGQRLLNTSEDGSTLNYDSDGSTNAVTFTSAPAADVQIKILQKKGQVWYSASDDGNPADGKGLQASTTQQAKFIADEPTNAPE